MIQDINKHFNNQYKSIRPNENDFVIEILGDSVLIEICDGRIIFPTVSQASETGVYLFSIEDKNYFSGKIADNNNYEYQNVRKLREIGDKASVFAAITAYHICSWYTASQFCGVCGNKMTHSDTERAMVCSCGNTVYPRINPAVIVAIINKDKICMTKYNRGYAHWALVAGYTEIGETIEQTVHREVIEETGLKVKNLQFYKSQPWGLSSSLLCGFFCETDGTDEIKIDNTELKEGKWFSAEEITFENDNFSLTREMIDVFKQKKHCSLLQRT